MTSEGRRGGEILKFVTCLHILLFLGSRSIVHFADGGGVDVMIVWSLILKLALIKK